jgi:hypothetical protein
MASGYRGAADARGACASRDGYDDRA